LIWHLETAGTDDTPPAVVGLRQCVAKRPLLLVDLATQPRNPVHIACAGRRKHLLCLRRGFRLRRRVASRSCRRIAHHCRPAAYRWACNSARAGWRLFPTPP